MRTVKQTNGAALNQYGRGHCYDPDRLLNIFMQRCSIHGDKALAKRLGFAPQVLEGLRSGRIPVAPWMLRSISEAGGLSVEEVRELLGDRRSKARPTVMLGPAVRDEGDG
jgi:DNA-binding transcriptional regulator YdaS (Cro superfamily)